MIHSITDRDDDAIRMKACWKKIGNFMTTFAVDYFRLQQEFEDGKYGSDWPFRRWLLLKVAASEESVLTLLKAREHALSAEEREERDRAADRLRRVKHAEWRVREAEKDAMKAEKQSKRDAEAAIKAQKDAEKAAIKAQKDTEKAEADADAKKAAKAKRQKQRDKDNPNRNAIGRHAIAMNRGTPELKAVTPNLDPDGKAIMTEGKLPLTTCARIADFPAEQQAEEIARAFDNRHVRPHQGRKRPNIVTALPDEPPELLQLAIGIKSDLDIAADNDSMWIDSMVAAACKTALARRLHRDDISFGAWWDDHGLKLKKNDRAALAAMGEQPGEMRAVLEEHNSRSLQLIYRDNRDRFPSVRKPTRPNGSGDNSFEQVIY